MSHCAQRRMDWYLKRDLAEKIDDKTFKLKFPPKGMGNSKDVEYFKEERSNHCVVCGTKENLTIHHIVPYCYRKHFPVETKSRNSFDVMCVCHECHDEYERTAEKQKRDFAKAFGIGFDNTIDKEIRQINKIVGAAQALQMHHTKMPVERIDELEHFLSFSFGYEVTTDNVAEVIAKEQLEKHRIQKGQDQTSKLVLEAFLAEGNEIIDFILFWREHFLEHAKPQYISELWLEGYQKREW